MDNLGGERLASIQGPDWRWAGNPDGVGDGEGPGVVDEGLKSSEKPLGPSAGPSLKRCVFSSSIMGV